LADAALRNREKSRRKKKEKRKKGKSFNVERRIGVTIHC
jgi:hypothetical protein